MTALDRRRSSAFALNERGEVVGWSRITSSERTHAVLWRMGRMVDLGRANGPSGEVVDSEGWAINERTQVIVGSTGAGGQEFLWQDRVRIGLGIDASRGETTMNDRGQVVGSRSEAGGGAAVWEDGKVTKLPNLPGATDSSAAAINGHGQIVGRSRTKGGEIHAVLWTSR